MRSKGIQPFFILTAAFAFGCWADALFRSGGLGMNLPLWFLPIAFVMAAFTIAGGDELQPSTALWLIVAMVCSAIPAVRASDFLAFLSLMATLLALALAGLSQARFTLHNTDTTHVVYAFVCNGMISVFAFLHWIPVSRMVPTTGRYKPDERFFALLRGLVLSLPAAVIFISLFASADVQYNRVLTGLVDIDFETVVSHTFVIGFFAWVALALLVFFFFADKFLADGAGITIDHKPMVIELLVVVSVVCLIFASYVYVQLGYLFGGVEHIMRTPDLTVAEYARRGFFESAFACALVLILLQTSGEYVAHRAASSWSKFSGLAVALVCLSLIVIASAYQRIMIYTDYFGLTQDRFYVYVGLSWMAVCFVWLIVTLLLPLRRQFILGAIGLAFATLFVTAMINPDAFVASTNLTRLERTEKFDGAYVHQLSADAVPVLVNARDLLTDEQWSYVAEMRSNRNDLYSERGIWSWNLGHERSIRTTINE